MAYLNNIPTASQRLKDSQPEIKANFEAIKDLIDINHETFGSANEGKHKYVSMPEQVAAPSTAANEMALYTKAVAGVSELFVRRESDGDELNLTSATKATTGTTTLPSGIIVKWGTGTTNGAGAATITFAAAFTTLYTVYATVSNAAGVNTSGSQDAYVRIYTYDATHFDVVGFRLNTARDRLAVPFHWYAIGV